MRFRTGMGGLLGAFLAGASGLSPEGSAKRRLPQCLNVHCPVPESDALVHDVTEGMPRLLEIMARLRAPDGCPWDIEQTFATIAPYTLEEAHEVADAIEREAWDG